MPSATDAAKGELVRLPNGLGVFYVDRDHAYYRCNEDDSRGRRYTGVTTAIAPISFKPDALMKWAAKLNAVGIARLVEEALEVDDPEVIRANLSWLDSENPDRIWRILEESKLTYNDIRDAKAVAGTNIHEVVLRQLAEGREVPELEKLADDERGRATAVIDFWLAHKPEPEQVEQIVADEKLGVAGRFDLRSRFQACGDLLCPCHKGGVGLVDCKTGKYAGFEKDHVQVALYSYLAESCGFGETDWTAILHVTDDGLYRLIEGQASAKMARDTVGLYRAAGTINSRSRKAFKARL